MKSFSILSTTFQTSGNYRNSACYNLGTTPVGILCNTVQSDPLNSKQLQLMVFSMLKVRSNHMFDNIKGIQCGLIITSKTSTYFACASLPEFCIAYVHQYFFFWFFFTCNAFYWKRKDCLWSKSQKVPFISAMVQLLSYSKGRHSFNRASLLDKKWIPGDGGFCIDLAPVQEERVVMLLFPVWYGTQFELKLSVL